MTASVLDVNPLALPHPRSSCSPLHLLTLFLFLALTLSAVPLTLALSWMSTKCCRITSRSFSTPLTICYGTDTVPLAPQYFVAAYTFSPFRVQQTWRSPNSAVLAPPSSRPRYVPPTNNVKEAVRSSAADVRLLNTLARPPVTQPADDDVEMAGPTIEGEVVYSPEVEAAFSHLLHSLAHPPFSLDENQYYALSQLPLTYPWPSITIDLRPYVPFLERHIITHLVAGRCLPMTVDVPAHTMLDAWLKLLAEAIVHGIFFPHAATYTPPPLPTALMSSRFWHAHQQRLLSWSLTPRWGWYH